MGLDEFARFCGLLTLENGKPMELEPFQRTMLQDYFDGTRETLVLIPKKNGKSTLVSALALHHLLTDPGAECVIAAASRDQATIIFDQCAGFVRRSEGLDELVHVQRGYRIIRNRNTAGRIRILASDVDTADGVIPTLALVDELHRHKDNGELYGVFRDGLGPKGGKMVAISTAGDDEASMLGRTRTKAHKLPTTEKNGAHLYCRSDDFVMHEWALTEDDILEDMSVVKQANPASWQTEDELRKRFDSPSMTKWGWARFACGVWLQGEGAAISPGEWDALCEPGVEIPVGSPVWVGMDLGWKVDCTALVPLWWDSEERRVSSNAIVLEPEGDGTPLDDRLIVDALVSLSERFTVMGVVYDPNAGGQQMVQNLEREHDIPFVEHSQTNSPIALADARLMEAIRRKDLVHDGDPVVRQHVLNAVEKPLGGEKFRFDRARRGPRKPIDALRALAMAHSVAVADAQEPEKASGTFYSF